MDFRVPRTRYPILQEFISDFNHKFPQKLRVQWSPRLPSLKSANDKWRELCSEMRLEPPLLSLTYVVLHACEGIFPLLLSVGVAFSL